MNLNIKQNEQYIFAYKPTGISTHAPNDTIYGFVEYLSKTLNLELKVCHRLDKETSGAIVFAKNAPAAKELGALFEKCQVRKSYLFVTDRSYTKRVFTVEKNDSKTVFTHIKQDRKLSLWEATPTTGKYHQIRIHAAESCIPILGDREYRGTSFPRLMLHAASIECDLFKHTTPAPSYFNKLDYLKDKQLTSWLIAAENRKALFSYKENETLRLIHNEDSKLHADKYGSVTCFYWYGSSAAPKDKIDTYCKLYDIENYSIATMNDRGDDGSTVPIIKSAAFPDVWHALENEATFELRLGQGFSPGLFLDQRNNRSWVKKNSKEKSVLNLFSYTGAFSVAAALGGAINVVSVDTSQTSHDWAIKNFTQNSLDPNNSKFIVADVRNFLKETNDKFDIIICDPPTFARSKSGVFSIEKECKGLIERCLSMLNSKGSLLFSTNYEKWALEDLKKQIDSAANITVITNHSDLDFEMPGTAIKMKSLVLTKLS